LYGGAPTYGHSPARLKYAVAVGIHSCARRHLRENTMTDDIYSPPAAPIINTEVSLPEFYVVSKRKFLILFIATLGAYQLYWCYRNWQLQKLATALDIWPAVRAFFLIFFYHSLFRRIDHRLRQNDRKFYWSPNAYATGVVALTLISNVLDRLTINFADDMSLQLLSMAMVPVLAMTHLPAQQAINQCCNDADGNSNNALTPINYVWTGLGMIVWALTIVGTLSPASG
jgi:hypothetical protein